MEKAYFWTFWTISHGGKSRNDTKPMSGGCRESKNRFLKNLFPIFKKNCFHCRNFISIFRKYFYIEINSILGEKINRIAIFRKIY
jgi:hypothetical protein